MATTAETPEERSRFRRRESERTDATTSQVTKTSEEAPVHLELANDEYAQSILESLGAGPKRGRDLLEECEASRATIYRRLNRLVDAGFVEEEMALDPDGHHCKQFRLVRDTVTVTISDGRLTVTVK